MDGHLAEIYRVTTKRLNEQVKRNRARFPEDFMFQLTLDEAKQIPRLRSQNATLNRRGTHLKHAPHVFTEHGAVMLASVLSTPVATNASILVVRAFVRLSAIIASHRQLARKLKALEMKCDRKFRAVFKTIQELLAVEEKPKRPIGFLPKN